MYVFPQKKRRRRSCQTGNSSTPLKSTEQDACLVSSLDKKRKAVPLYDRYICPYAASSDSTRGMHACLLACLLADMYSVNIHTYSSGGILYILPQSRQRTYIGIGMYATSTSLSTNSHGWLAWHYYRSVDIGGGDKTGPSVRPGGVVGDPRFPCLLIFSALPTRSGSQQSAG